MLEAFRTFEIEPSYTLTLKAQRFMSCILMTTCGFVT